MTVLAVGAPATVLSFIHSNLLRCEGMAAWSMAGSVFGTILNIILDPILIFAFHLGAAGAAIATVIGYLCSDLFFLIILFQKSCWLSVSLPKCRIDFSEARQIFGVGFTAAVTNIMQSAAVILLNQFLLPYGNEKIASMGIVLRISMIAQLILVGFSFGGIPLFGFLYGADKKEKLRELTFFVLKFLCSLALVLSLLLILSAPVLMSFFAADSQMIADGALMLRLQMAGSIFCAAVLLFTVLFQAFGRVLPAFLMSISRQGIVFFLALIFLKTLFGYHGILAAQAVADLISAGIGLLLFRNTIRK